MMNCEQARAELNALLDDELPAARAVELRHHLARCVTCQAELESLRAVARGIAALPRLEPAPQFLQDVRRRLRATDEPRWVTTLFRPFWLKIPLEAVALIVVLGAIGVLTWRTPTRRRAAVDQAKSPARQGGRARVSGELGEDSFGLNERFDADHPREKKDQVSPELETAGEVSRQRQPQPMEGIVAGAETPLFGRMKEEVAPASDADISGVIEANKPSSTKARVAAAPTAPPAKRLEDLAAASDKMSQVNEPRLNTSTAPPAAAAPATRDRRMGDLTGGLAKAKEAPAESPAQRAPSDEGLLAPQAQPVSSAGSAGPASQGVVMRFVITAPSVELGRQQLQRAVELVEGHLIEWNAPKQSARVSIAPDRLVTFQDSLGTAVRLDPPQRGLATKNFEAKGFRLQDSAVDDQAQIGSDREALTNASRATDSLSDDRATGTTATAGGGESAHISSNVIVDVELIVIPASGTR